MTWLLAVLWAGTMMVWGIRAWGRLERRAFPVASPPAPMMYRHREVHAIDHPDGRHEVHLLEDATMPPPIGP